MIQAPTITGCTGKKAFDAFKRADGVARRMNRRDGGAHLSAYRCRHCGLFHVGADRGYGKMDKRREVQPC